jgi:hypothetical protein
VRRLTDADLRRMFALFEQYYVDVSLEQFKSDIAEKTHVFVFKRGPELVGFSTIYRRRFPELAKGTFLFSGDTVLSKDCWGSKILQTTFFRYIVQSKLLSPTRPVYWMLISKGCKTYLMMRKNFGESFPRYDRETPRELREVMSGFYRMKFGEAFDAGTGRIAFPESHGAVKGAIAAPTAEMQKDPDVRHFLELNPGYRDGVELACLAEIRFTDFLGHVPKYFFKARQPRAERAPAAQALPGEG